MPSTSKMYKNQPGPSIKGPGLFILNILLIHQYNQEIAVIIIRGSTPSRLEFIQTDFLFLF